MTAQSKRFRTRLTRNRQNTLFALYHAEDTNDDMKAAINEVLSILALPTDFLVVTVIEVADEEIPADELEGCPVRNCTFTASSPDQIEDHLVSTHKLSRSKAHSRVFGS